MSGAACSSPSPYVSPGSWRRVCVLLCPHCSYLEFPGCAAHRQLYSQVEWVWTPPPQQPDEAEAELPGRPPAWGERRLAMGCTSCTASTATTHPFATHCRGCRAVRANVLQGMVTEQEVHAAAETFLQDTRAAPITHLLESAVLHCRACGALEFPTLASVSAGMEVGASAARSAADAATSAIAAESSRATVPAALAREQNTAASAAAAASPRAAAFSAAEPAATAASGRPPVPGFLFKSGEVGDPKWLLGAECFDALLAEFEAEIRAERSVAAQLLPAADEPQQQPHAENDALPPHAADHADVAAIAAENDAPAQPSGGSIAPSIAASSQQSASLTFTEAEKDRLRNRIQHRCRQRVLELRAAASSVDTSCSGHYELACAGSWELVHAALSFTEVSYLRNNFLATPLPPLTLERYRIHAAVRSDDAKALNAILATPHLQQRLPELINECDAAGHAPLHIAAWYGSYSCLRLLLAQPSINVHVRDRSTTVSGPEGGCAGPLGAEGSGRTPLQYALEWKHAACIKALVWAGAATPVGTEITSSDHAAEESHKRHELAPSADGATTTSATALSSSHAAALQPPVAPASPATFAATASGFLPLRHWIAQQGEGAAAADAPDAAAVAAGGGPPAAAMQHLAEAQAQQELHEAAALAVAVTTDIAQPASDAALGPRAFDTQHIDPALLLQSEQAKLTLLLGLHARVGSASPLRLAFASSPLFERNLLRDVFQLFDPFSFDYCEKRSAAARRKAQALRTVPPAAGEEEQPKREYDEEAVPADPALPFNVPWTSAKRLLDAAERENRGSSVEVTPVVAEPPSADAAAVVATTTQAAPAPAAVVAAAAAPSSPARSASTLSPPPTANGETADMTFLFSLTRQYTSRRLDLPTQLQPFVPAMFLPCEVPPLGRQAGIEPMLKPLPPERLGVEGAAVAREGESSVPTTVGSPARTAAALRRRDAEADAAAIGLSMLDELDPRAQSDPDELRAKLARLRAREVQKQQRLAAAQQQSTSPRGSGSAASGVTPKRGQASGRIVLSAASSPAPHSPVAVDATASLRAPFTPSPSKRSPGGKSDLRAEIVSMVASASVPVSPAAAAAAATNQRPASVAAPVNSPELAASELLASAPTAGSGVADSAVTLDKPQPSYEDLLAELQRKNAALQRIGALVEARPESAAALGSIHEQPASSEPFPLAVPLEPLSDEDAHAQVSLTFDSNSSSEGEEEVATTRDRLEAATARGQIRKQPQRPPENAVPTPRFGRRAQGASAAIVPAPPAMPAPVNSKPGRRTRAAAPVGPALWFH